MFDQPGPADRQVLSNLRRRTSAEGTTDGDRYADERSDSTCEQLHVRHLNAGSAREGPNSTECPDCPARPLSLDRCLSVRLRDGKSCAVHCPQLPRASVERQPGRDGCYLLLAALPRLKAASSNRRGAWVSPHDQYGRPGHRLADARLRDSERQFCPAYLKPATEAKGPPGFS